MKLKDLENGSTWVIGIQDFSTALFVRRFTASESPYSRFPWQWTARLVGACTFASREDAERFLHSDRFGIFLIDTLSKTELPRVRALKVELRVGT